MKYLIALLFPVVAFASIPDVQPAQVGGTPGAVVLEKVARTDVGRAERWSFRFKRPDGGLKAPRWQLRTEAEDSFVDDDGHRQIKDAARLVLLLREVRRAVPTVGQFQEATRGSRYARTAMLFPPLDPSDRAIEIGLKKGVQVRVIENPGELVLELSPM